MTHQGYIGSLGTSAMLVASAISILLIVGTIVAFEGFPGPSVDDSSDAFPVQALVSEPPEPQRVTASPDPSARPAASATAPAASIAPPVDVEEELQASASPAPVLPTTPDTPPPPTVEPPTASDTDGSSGGGGGPSLSKTLTDTTQALESTVERVLPVTEPIFDTLHRLGR